MTPKLTIAYVTGRKEPHLDWFIESLSAQIPDDWRWKVELLVIDGQAWSPEAVNEMPRGEIALTDPRFHNAARHAELQRLGGGKFSGLLVPPLPCAWQGPFRQTTRDFFCASNTRNTAFVVARSPYVVFVDDLSVLSPGWFNQVIHASTDAYVVCGSYKKVKQIKVANGRIESFEEYPGGVDSRWSRGSDGGVVPWTGGGLYGCSFGIPLDAALEVDGFDGVGNGGGFEDCDFGIRVERAGWPFYYNRNMLTLESEEDHHIGDAPVKFRKLVTADRLPKDYDSYKVPNEAEKYWSDHVILNRLCNETDRILPLVGYGLNEIRARYLETGLVPLPAPGQRDWRDGALLKDL